MISPAALRAALDNTLEQPTRFESGDGLEAWEPHAGTPIETAFPAREQAALALGILGAPEAAAPLTEALKDPSSRVRDAAARALAAIAHSGGQERLKIELRNTVIRGMTKALQDPDPGVRGQALEILSKLDR